MDMLYRIGAYAAVCAVAFYAGVWNGRYVEQDATLEAQAKARAEQTELRIGSAKRIAAVAQAATNERRAARDQLNRLRRTDQKLSIWYDARVPGAAVDYVWGVRELPIGASDRRGVLAGTTDRVTGAPASGRHERRPPGNP